MSASNYVHLEDCWIKKVTDKAALIQFAGDDDFQELWFPLSQIADGDSLEAGDGPITVSITEYIAREKGIEGDE